MDMNTWEKFVIPAGSAVFGTIVGSVGTTLLSNRAAEKARQAEEIKEQLEKL